MVNGRFTCDKVVVQRKKMRIGKRERERKDTLRYILMRDPFRGNYGLIHAFVNQPKEGSGLEESIGTIFVFRFRRT